MENTIDRIDYAKLVRNVDDCERFARDCLQEVLRNNPAPLLSAATANTKTRKSMRQEFRIVSLSLSHDKTSGFNVCAHSTKDCRALCVADSGLSTVWASINQARARKTVFLFQHRQAFLRQLIGELEQNRRSAENVGAILVARLNCFSDLPWHEPSFGCIPQLFAHYGQELAGGFIAYDYTKHHARVLNSETPPNWHLCGSWSEDTKHQEHCHQILMMGRNIAVPFAIHGPYVGNRALMQPIPDKFRLLGTDFRTFCGDSSDLRFLDEGPDARGYGRVCALRFKASSNAKRNAGLESGFVVTQD